MLFYNLCGPKLTMDKWVSVLKLTGVGFFIGGSIVLGVFIGLGVDGKLGTKLCWLVGLILGLAIAFYGVFEMLLPLLDNKRNKEN
jgi:hypothetical protein